MSCLINCITVFFFIHRQMCVLLFWERFCWWLHFNLKSASGWFCDLMPASAVHRYGQPEILTNMLELSSPRQQVKGKAWSWFSLSSHLLVGGGWVWSGDKLHYPGCAKYWLHGGAVGALQRLLPGWNLEHVHRRPQKKCSKPANEHWGRPHPAGAPKMEVNGWCHCRYTNSVSWCVCVCLSKFICKLLVNYEINADE